MINNVTRALGKRIGLGRLGLPVWVVGLAVLLVGAAAGQAVGPVLSGGVQGSAGLTVEQAVVLSTTATAVLNANDSVVTVNDEGTGFTAAIEIHVGDSPVLKLDVDNLSDAQANAILELNVPAGVDVEVEESADAGLREAQLTRNTWLMQVPVGETGDATDTIDVTISPKDDMKPGFYTITGRIIQVAN